jgi:RimJ/RimL family protein N-acetyltransferase
MRIQTERLILRDFAADDWPAVLAYQSDPRYLRLYAWTGRTEAEVRAFVQMFLDQQAEQPRRKFQLAVTLPGDDPQWPAPEGRSLWGAAPGGAGGDRVIGNCGIRRKPENDWEADIGYELAPGHWGKGYATEAARAMVAFGFRELGLHRVSAWCVADNTASAHVLEKCGLRLEGRLRESEFYKGRWWDTLLYGVLKREWEALMPDETAR